LIYAHGYQNRESTRKLIQVYVPTPFNLGNLQVESFFSRLVWTRQKLN